MGLHRRQTHAPVGSHAYADRPKKREGHHSTSPEDLAGLHPISTSAARTTEHRTSYSG